MKELVNILLVEEDTGDDAMLKQYLETSSLCYNLYRCNELDDAIGVLYSTNIGIVLIDLELPGNFGVENLTIISPHCKDIPIIVMTGCEDEEFAVKALKSGASDYLIKGRIDAFTLLRSLRYAMERHHTQRMLEATDRLLRVALTQMPVAVVLAKAPLADILVCNQAANEMMSTEPPADITQVSAESHLIYWSCHHPDGEVCHFEQYPLIQAIKYGLVTKNKEMLMKTREGDRWVSVSASPLLDDNGKIVAGIMMFPETTELKSAQQALLESRNEIHQYERMEAIGQLAGGVAHDFNNLLTVITSFAEFAVDELKDADPLKSDLVQILDAANRGSSLTKQLLAFSKKQVLEPVILDVNELLRDLEKMLDRLIGENIFFEMMYEKNIGMIHADPAQIDQVIVNLVVNARDAMPNGGSISLQTTNFFVDEEFVSLHPYASFGEFVRIRISDTGRGMSEAIMERIFEPFFSTKPHQKGTGLGLSTVYGIVKQSNGIIEVESVLGQGSIFNVYFPRAEGVVAQRTIPPDKLTSTNNESILLVEDESMVRALVERILVNAGYNVIIANSGGQALRELGQVKEPIDLLLTDVIMPKMSGRELVERIARKFGPVKVLYMSGYTDSELEYHGVLAPDAHFIAKPFRSKELLAQIRIVMGSTSQVQ